MDPYEFCRAHHSNRLQCAFRVLFLQPNLKLALNYTDLFRNRAKRHINALQTPSQASHSCERVPIKRRMSKTRGLQRYQHLHPRLTADPRQGSGKIELQDVVDGTATEPAQRIAYHLRVPVPQSRIAE